ncbi:MAG: O-methyltransferase [Alphaproteobacteria bacterium]
MRSSGGWDPDVLDYVLRTGVREHEVLRRCREDTARDQPLAVMQISPEQGAFMGLLTNLLDVQRYLEVGVFTGYSALSVALEMGPAGRVTACDISEEFLGIARGYWKEAGVSGRIESRAGPAADTLAELLEAGAADSYDMAFVDADKTGYDTYYEQCLKLVRPGGLILFDNVLWSGAVADASKTDENTQALRALNEKLHGDARIDYCLLPACDGIGMCRRR